MLSKMSSYLWIQFSRLRWIWSSLHSLKHHFPIKGQQAYAIIKVCVFVNTIQKEIDMEVDMDVK